MTFICFTNEMSIFLSISAGEEAKAQRARMCLDLPFHRKVHQPCWKTNQVFCVLVHSLIHQAVTAYRRAAILVMRCLYLQICFALFSSTLSLISDVSSSVAQPDTSPREEPCIFPSFSCPQAPDSLTLLIIQVLF